jgi:hypothetical protein
LWRVFWDRYLQTVCLGMASNLIFLISASWAARIIGVSHWRPAYFSVSCFGFLSQDFSFPFYYAACSTHSCLPLSIALANTAWHASRFFPILIGFQDFQLGSGVKIWTWIFTVTLGIFIILKLHSPT